MQSYVKDWKKSEESFWYWVLTQTNVVNFDD